MNKLSEMTVAEFKEAFVAVEELLNLMGGTIVCEKGNVNEVAPGDEIVLTIGKDHESIKKIILIEDK